MILVRMDDTHGYLTELFAHVPSKLLSELQHNFYETYQEANNIIGSLELHMEPFESLNMEDPKIKFLVNFKDFARYMYGLTLQIQNEHADTQSQKTTKDTSDKPNFKSIDWVYCTNCNIYHHPNNLQKDIRKEHEEICTNQLTGGYLDPYEYEDVVNEFIDCKCPECGKVLKSIFITTWHKGEEGYDEEREE